MAVLLHVAASLFCGEMSVTIVTNSGLHLIGSMNGYSLLRSCVLKTFPIHGHVVSRHLLPNESRAGRAGHAGLHGSVAQWLTSWLSTIRTEYMDEKCHYI